MNVLGLDTATNRWHAVRDDGRVGFCSELKGKAWDAPKPTGPIKKLSKQEKADYVLAQTEAIDKKRLQLRRTFRAWLVWEYGGGGVVEPPPVAIYCEEPLALQNGKTTRQLSLAAGALWDVAHELLDEAQIQMTWHWVDVSHWKRVVVGNGNADKDAIREYVIATFDDVPVDEWDEEPDLYDSRCLLQYGLHAQALGQRPRIL